MKKKTVIDSQVIAVSKESRYIGDVISLKLFMTNGDSQVQISFIANYSWLGLKSKFNLMQHMKLLNKWRRNALTF